LYVPEQQALFRPAGNPHLCHLKDDTAGGGARTEARFKHCCEHSANTFMTTVTWMFRFAGIGTTGCNSMAPRTLESVTVSPSVADARNFPNGDVHFVASATFNQPPTPVTPYQVSSWLVTPPSLATIDQNGVARVCVAGQSGTATIEIEL
jgi:hypothetical protein